MARLSRGRLVLIAVLVLLGLCVGFAVYGHWEAGQIQVVERELAFDALPPAFDGFRIIHLSCIHTRGYGRVERRLRRLLEGLEADLLVVAGDFKAHVTTPPAPALASVERIFEGLDYPCGRVGVGGNHDWGAFVAELRARGRFDVLIRESLLLEKDGEAIALLGVHTARPLGGRGDHEIDECAWVGNVRRRSQLWPLLPDAPARPWDCDRLAAGGPFRILRLDRLVDAAMLAHSLLQPSRCAERRIPNQGCPEPLPHQFVHNGHHCNEDGVLCDLCESQVKLAIPFAEDVHICKVSVHQIQDLRHMLQRSIRT